MSDQRPYVAYIAVGSNIDPEENLLTALDELQRAVTVEAVSTVYRTAPLGRPEQPEYLNAVFRVRTDATPRMLKFEVLRKIEAKLGRVRINDKYAERTIDLDVIVYGDQVIKEPDLTIPDPDVRTRPFVAVPLLELAPDMVLADNGDALAALPVVHDAKALQPDPAMTQKLNERLLDEPRSR